MYILEHLDWYGSIKDLEELEKKLKEACNEAGVEFLGRFAPHNKKFHWTLFYRVKDLKDWLNVKFDWYKRDRKVHTHSVMEYYG
jgi:hypothetical protein